MKAGLTLHLASSMTLYVPLGDGKPPASPSSLKMARDNSRQLDRAAKAIAKAKRIVIVCGAGVSVHAGIPDFRSADGLFTQLKKEHPKEGLTSGRELFDASVFHSESTATIFYKMIGRLARMAEEAEPTPFHELLKGLDERGQLLRCYTQNIDGIEEKAGLSLGVPLPPPFTPKKSPKKARKRKTEEEERQLDVNGGSDSTSQSPSPVPTPSPTPSTAAAAAAVVADDTPRCIPLHGTLKSLHCHSCGATAKLGSHRATLENGTAPWCVQCSEFEHTRQLVGKRLRGVGVMRPSIVLYNEDHREGERVGDIVKRDLTGGRTKRAPPDLLLVAGTSLRVPGTKRIVKEFSKAARCGVVVAGAGTASAGGSGSPSSTAVNGRSRSTIDEEDRPIRTIYLNLDFPAPAREWEFTFDVWVQGDIQEFVGRIQNALREEDVPRRQREERAMMRSAEKRKRDEGEGDVTQRLASAMHGTTLKDTTTATATATTSSRVPNGNFGEKRRKLVPVVERVVDPLPLTVHIDPPTKSTGSMDIFGPVLLSKLEGPHPERHQQQQQSCETVGVGSVDAWRHPMVYGGRPIQRRGPLRPWE